MSAAPTGALCGRPAWRWAGLSFCALAAAACASQPRRDPQLGVPVVALLIPANQSIDIEAPAKVRAALAAAMRERGYKLLDPAETDAALKELGHTSGDTLGALRPSELKAKLPADWYVYPTIEDFVFKSAVALSQRKVSLKLRVLEGAGGPVVFEGDETGISSSAGLQAAGDLGLHVAGKVAKAVKDSAKQVLPGKGLKSAADATDQVADVDLTAETGEAVGKLLDKLDQVRFPAK